VGWLGASRSRHPVHNRAAVARPKAQIRRFLLARLFINVLVAVATSAALSLLTPCLTGRAG